MPELPEVHTTVTYLNRKLKGLVITDSWSGYDSAYYRGKAHIKDTRYFATFKRKVKGQKITKVTRHGKNIVIHLEVGFIAIHMKMTGHLILGTYHRVKHTKDIPEAWKQETWVPDRDERPALWDPFNRWIRFTLSLSDGKTLILSDMRKFATVRFIKTLEEDEVITRLGPNPLELSFAEFQESVLKKSNGRIKTVLMDQSVVAGIGNIYSDEALWLARIHPESTVSTLPKEIMKKLFTSLTTVLTKGVELKGDSTSDYRQPDGTPGNFHHHHRVYQRAGERCSKKGCSGIITRKVVQGRSAHFCEKHQVLYK